MAPFYGNVSNVPEASTSSAVPRESATASPAEGVSDTVSRYLRQFVSRARGRGAHRLPCLEASLRAASRRGDGCLDQAEFEQVTLAEGLCRCNFDCRNVFTHFAAGQGFALVSDIMLAARGVLSHVRAAAVQDVWEQLDLQGVGSAFVEDLLAAFDARRLPDVRFGRLDAEGACREFLEGLGVSSCVAADRSADFNLEEAAAGRRPRPTGTMGGGPLLAPAGRPGGARGGSVRNSGDAYNELAARPPAVAPGLKVSKETFEAYYASVSAGIADDNIFEHTVRDAWMGAQVHEAANTARSSLQVVKHGRNPACIRVYGTMQDGSRRVLSLRNDWGLESISGAAGTGNGQIWTWGSKVKAEILRRFQAEGLEGIQSVSLNPF